MLESDTAPNQDSRRGSAATISSNCIHGEWLASLAEKIDSSLPSRSVRAAVTCAISGASHSLQATRRAGLDRVEGALLNIVYPRLEHVPRLQPRYPRASSAVPTRFHCRRTHFRAHVGSETSTPAGCAPVHCATASSTRACLTAQTSHAIGTLTFGRQVTQSLGVPRDTRERF